MLATCVYLNTITQSTPSTYMSAHAHICTPIQMDLESAHVPSDGHMDVFKHAHTYPPRCMGHKPIMAHNLALTLSGAVWAPSRLRGKSGLQLLVKEIRGKGQWVRVQPGFRTSPVSPPRSPEDFHADPGSQSGVDGME